MQEPSHSLFDLTYHDPMLVKLFQIGQQQLSRAGEAQRS